MNAKGTFDPATAERVLRELAPGGDTEARVAESLRAIYAEEHPEDLAALEASLDATDRLAARAHERPVLPRSRTASR